MRTRFFLMLFIIASMVITCSKDSDTPSGPSDTDGNGNGNATPTSFVLTKHLVTTELPNFVTVLMQVTDLAGKGVDFLTVDRFQIEEQGQRLDNGMVSAYVLKKTSMNYNVRTKILIDNNAGTNLDLLKKGAVKVVEGIDLQQEIAIYSISDKLQMVLDYSSDVSALTTAINSITASGETSNLYTGIMEAKRDRDDYQLAAVTQHTYVIFTDSNDEAGTIQQDAIGPLTSQVKIYTVGLGNVDASKLDDIGVAYFGAADEAGILTAATKVQTEILKYANSLYRLSYRSALRNGSGHSLKITIAGNTNPEKSAQLEDSFNSSPFVDVQDGLYVNWSYSNPQGVDMVMVRVGTQRTVKLLSMGGSKESKFTIAIQDPNVATGLVGAGGFLTITARG
ncbi:VWA domain-containing protein, partial [candidate division KSB1 bacterium]|nr:VWA domain-containing protein [candidate division KSB1 bacterium]